jgi:riboflavin kinase/FMN adenylyltransferase
MQVITELKAAASYLSPGSVVTIGTYDGVHRGHDVIIGKVVSEARAAGLKSLLVTFAPHPKQVVAPDQAPGLLTTHDEKLRLLEARELDAVFVIEFDTEFAKMSSKAFLEQYLIGGFKCRHLIVGYNHAFGHRREGNAEFLQEHAGNYGYRFTVTEPIINGGEAIHSSRIRQEIENGNFGYAVDLLGHDCVLSGVLVRGNSLGRQLGYPTINVQLPPEQLVPPAGVYAAYVEVDSMRHYGMMYIPENPDGFAVEVNMFDFDADLYGCKVRVCPTSFIRDNRRFAAREDLVNQIGRDATEIKRVLKLD